MRFLFFLTKFSFNHVSIKLAMFNQIVFFFGLPSERCLQNFTKKSFEIYFDFSYTSLCCTKLVLTFSNLYWFTSRQTVGKNTMKAFKALAYIINWQSCINSSHKNGFSKLYSPPIFVFYSSCHLALAFEFQTNSA